MTNKQRNRILQNVIEESYNYAEGADNPRWLTKQMRTYLLSIIKRYNRDELPTELDINRVEDILIKNYYKNGDVDFLNSLKKYITK